MPAVQINGRTYEEVAVTATPAKPLPVDIQGATLSLDAEALTPTTTRVSASTSSVLLITAADDREGIAINNRSTATLYLSFSSPATDANSFLAMAPNSFLVFDRQLIIASAIYGIWSAANGAAHVTTFS